MKRETITGHITSQRDDLLGLLQRLVRIRTVNPPGENYDEITRLLVREMELSGLKVRRLTLPERDVRRTLPEALWGFPRYNVIGFRPVKGAKRTIHFNAHYDVVPTSGVWRHGDAFSGAVEGGWMYGRGTSDMKGSMASLLVALRALRAAGVEPRMNVEVSFTADEETDSELGTGWLVKHAPIKPDYALVMEGGEGSRIGCGHNGVVWLEVTVLGRAAHGSRPDLGVNALEHMASLVLMLREHAQEIGRRVFRAPDGVELRPTLNVGGVFGQAAGGKINTVPADATFSIDRRVLPGESVATAERELRAFLAAAAKRIPGGRIRVRKVTENHSCFVSPEQPYFAAMQACVEAVRRKPAVFGVSTGFNDMHFFAHHLKIPTLGYGPGGRSEHAIDESARVSDLLNAARIYAELLVGFSG